MVLMRKCQIDGTKWNKRRKQKHISLLFIYRIWFINMMNKAKMKKHKAIMN